MKRVAVAALLAAALLGSGCVGYRTKLAEDAQRDGNHERAYRLWKSLARRGETEAHYRLALMLSLGQGVRQDEDRAVRYFRKAASAGHDEAATKLAYIYLGGRGHPEDDPSAEQWMRRAAEIGSVDTQYRLGRMYLEGSIVEQSDEEGLAWLEQAAAKWPKGSRSIGKRLDEDGLLQRMATRGFAEAQHHIGQKYASGSGGMPQSKAEAAKWFYLAAKQDHVPAQVMLGWIYGQGDGVPKDHKEAVRWFLKAAGEDDAEAQYQSGLMYDRGVGVDRDRVQAHAWFNLAASKGHQKARLKRDELSQNLSPVERIEAERLAVEWAARIAE